MTNSVIVDVAGALGRDPRRERRGSTWAKLTGQAELMAGLHYWTALQAALCGFLLTAAVMAAAEDGAAVVNLENGRAIAQANCAECHAIARDDQIPTRANADTAFRDLHRRFPINMLTDAAKTGTIEGHDEMAGFDFSLNDVRDLLGYIDSLAPEQAGRYLGG